MDADLFRHAGSESPGSGRQTPTPAYRGTTDSLRPGWKPKPLTSGQLDPVTGKIGWTRELRREPFAIDRDVLEPIFGRRAASNGVVSDDDYDKIQEIVADMQRDLKQRVKKVPANDYIASKRLLESLAYEADL